MPIAFANPIQDIIEAATRAFPDLDCEVDFADEMNPDTEAMGVTIWPDDGSRTQVFARLDLSLENLVEVLAHEFAHVAAGPEAAHGPAWESAFSKIQAEWDAAMSQR